MAGYLRIGEVSRRTGVGPEVLRAWESRYGLLRPDRSPGGFRLYGDDDVARVEAMQRLLAEGVAAGQAAARAAAAATAPAGEGAAAGFLAELARALDELDEAGANGVLDRAVAAFSVDALIEQLVLPYLAELGERWERGEVSVAHEHFASAVLRGRLLGLARGWGRGGSPHALLACAPAEEHDLPLVCLGLALRSRGWRVTYLGARTPVKTLREIAGELRPDLCVVSATVADGLGEELAALRDLAATTRLVLGGPGVDPSLAERLGVTRVDGSPVVAADLLGH